MATSARRLNRKSLSFGALDDSLRDSYRSEEFSSGHDGSLRRVDETDETGEEGESNSGGMDEEEEEVVHQDTHAAREEAMDEQFEKLMSLTAEVPHVQEKVEAFYHRLHEVIVDARKNFQKEFKKMKAGKNLKEKDDEIYNAKLKLVKMHEDYRKTSKLLANERKKVDILSRKVDKLA
eukprot:CAMPEP_0113911724 /NCGR_PEP_ID=MMETSP0780_2-20120614/28410_1 /TAXON_ID=652834 /ORGANISM="Palpitomonas bilix" /LENGTH=177 /DNA_ID=CAMNT_0000908363 /DNA_START=116 /DNA_END=645 /DNA_ORIENTATION=- /assembly_acc=CAM_ASM_000599